MPIKYLGSKRRFTDKIVALASSVGARTALDGFTGTTRVAQALKKSGIYVTASDIATYSEIFAECYISTDADDVDIDDIEDAITYLSSLNGKHGYFTETFCEESRFIQPANGMKIDAIRDMIEQEYKGTLLYPILLTSLIEAADRVDSTTGVQMAYLKEWSKRSYNSLELRAPELIPGNGDAIRGDIFDVLNDIPHQDLIYLDPPYNQHRYYTNYHIWETLTRWDAPEHYGVACKRADARDDSTKSVFNSKRKAPDAIKKMITQASEKCDTLLLSYNDESFINKEQIMKMMHDSGFESTTVFAFDYNRYVGARIGIYNPSGEKVGSIDHTKNHEYIFACSSTENIKKMQRALSTIQ